MDASLVSSPPGSDRNSERTIFGSIISKHARPSGGAEEEQWPTSKVPRSDALVSEALKAAPFLLSSFPRTTDMSDQGRMMLSFTSTGNDAGVGFFNHFNNSTSSSSSSNALSSLRNEGAELSGSINGAMARVRGPFTPSQWMELEHQALIYKHLAAKAPIPSSLLIPIRRSFGIPCFPYPTTYFGSNPSGYGSFHLGHTGNVDAEPGRCRRTDGKKWRCSRDAVADQKYCERHMNRGRHRSRKHVEGHHPGHAAKPMPAAVMTAQLTAAAAVRCGPPRTGGRGSDTSDACAVPPDRTAKCNDNFSQGSANLKLTTNNSFSCPKQHNPFEHVSSTEYFGFISSNSLRNTAGGSSEINFHLCQNLKTESPPQSAQKFVDGWLSTHTDGPMLQSPLSAAIGDLDAPGEHSRGDECWIPAFREDSVGGPLGEALTKSKVAAKDWTADLSLSSSVNMLSSPTGVLQKTTFGSVSSSTGSSPRLENHSNHDGIGNLIRDDLGSILLKQPRTTPSL